MERARTIDFRSPKERRYAELRQLLSYAEGKVSVDITTREVLLRILPQLNGKVAAKRRSYAARPTR